MTRDEGEPMTLPYETDSGQQEAKKEAFHKALADLANHGTDILLSPSPGTIIRGAAAARKWMETGMYPKLALLEVIEGYGVAAVNGDESRIDYIRSLIRQGEIQGDGFEYTVLMDGEPIDEDKPI